MLYNLHSNFNGKSLPDSSSFLIGCAFNPSADNLDRELLVLDRKLKAGAHFILTQPVYSPETLDSAIRILGFPSAAALRSSSVTELQAC